MITAIIVGAGKSARMNSSLNKLLMTLLDKPVICETIEKFENSDIVSQIILVLNDDNKDQIASLAEKYGYKKIKKIVLGGRERQDSVWQGIKAVEGASPEDIILIHNAANPFIDHETIKKTAEAASQFGAAAAAIKTKDTIKEANLHGFVEKTLDRKKLWRMQTPQAMKYGLAVRAFVNALNDGFYATDDAALVERLGEDVKIIECPEENLKITHSFDLERAKQILHSHEARIGIGLDSHRFAGSDVPLVLGGVEIPGEDGLEANSDGDVILHSLFNALSQAIGGKSIGFYADQMCKDGVKNSKEYIALILGKIKEKNYTVNNIGIMVEAKRPRLDDYSEKIKESISSICCLGKERIGITATSGESLTEFGKGLGIQVFTIASLRKNG